MIIYCYEYHHIFSYNTVDHIGNLLQIDISDVYHLYFMKFYEFTNIFGLFRYCFIINCSEIHNNEYC